MNHMSTVITTPLTGRVAIVTGASSGIGEATAYRLATLGAKVAIAARRTDNLDALATRISASGGTALPLTLDVTDRPAVNAAAQQVADHLGPVDLVFNNAGVQLISPIDDVRFDDWQHQIDLNITGVMNVIGAFVPQLIDSAAQGKRIRTQECPETLRPAPQARRRRPAVVTRPKNNLLKSHPRVDDVERDHVRNRNHAETDGDRKPPEREHSPLQQHVRGEARPDHERGYVGLEGQSQNKSARGQ